MKELIHGLRALGAPRLAAMGAVAVAVLALLALLALRGGGEHMALLYADLDTREAGQIADILDRQHIAYQLGRQGSEIMVPEGAVSRARLLLARDGLPSGGGIGYELFDRNEGLVASQFQQTISQTRALEGELARTIRAMQGVRGARVHLVLPRREPFALREQDAQASVLLTLAGPGRLDHEAVQAILTLVSAAVPGLRPQNVAVIDTHGNLLARAGGALAAGADATLEELRHATETRLSRAVEDMLERSLGAGKVRAEAAVEMDYDQVHETEERFDPDGQVTRGTQTVTDSSRSTEPAAATTVQNNLPNADAGSASTGSQDQKQEETTNYEISKTVRTLMRDHPHIRRISLAVLVDGVETRDDKGAARWQPQSEENLERIRTLVRSAIGYDEKRGDRVEIVSMRFAAEPGSEAQPTLLPGGLEKPDLVRLAQTALLGLIALAALLFVLRPMVLRIARAGADEPALLAMGGAPGTLAAAGMGIAGAGVTPGTGALLLPGSSSPETGGAAANDGGERGMIDVAHIEGQMRASSIRRLISMVQDHPEESLMIIRGWLQKDSGGDA